MPIFLDDLQASVASAKTYSPKFFDGKLTGVGKKTGILNENRDPGRVPPNQGTLSENLSVKKRNYTNGGTEVSIIPVGVLSVDAWSYMSWLPVPEQVEMTKLGEFQNPANPSAKPTALYFTMKPHSIVLQETRLSGQGGKSYGGVSKKCVPSYQMFWFVVPDGATATEAVMETNLNAALQTSSHGDVAYYQHISCNPKPQAIADLKQLAHVGVVMDAAAVDDYFDQYSLYDAMCARSEEWQTTIHLFLDKYFQNTSYHRAQGSTACMNVLASILHRIEDYNIPLDLYRDIYASIRKHFNDDDADVLCKENLNLLLSDTLHNLDANKASLSAIPAQNPPVTVPVRKVPFSPEQRKAITCTDPLVLVQSGAGTGKSSTILGRIDWMIACGIQPHDIMVLSFTNAAADHITDLNPDVHSMTIARMIHTIYTANFPRHELSTLDTIMNSIDIYFGNDDVAMRFKKVCRDVWKNEADGFTRMNNFVERHYDDVMKILDTIRQTSLELEIIICYQKIETLQEPPEVQSRYLIIDEVQDNSIFEFIYTLKYVDKHREALFIVGDCSQTLYEFRASNPKALNVLEGSGVFTTHQLQVNYRSRQEILDFANVALRNIEANQYANIQLRANSLRQVTEKSFTDAVKFKYHRLGKLGDLEDRMPSIFAVDLKSYLDGCLARGEHVAFLAFTRQTIGMVEEQLKAMYPTRQMVKLIPDKTRNTTLFSDFIRTSWSMVKFMPTKSIVAVITRVMMDSLTRFVPASNKWAAQKAADMLTGWSAQYSGVISAWERAHVAGQMPLDDFLDHVRETMLDYEIAANAMKQALMSQRNREMKEANAQVDADFILSTIHSAKGLEFQNVVVIYRNDNSIEEDKKRMYYVAFTRAMNSEFIVAYDTVASPAIEMDYNAIVDNLHRIAPASGQASGQLAIANAKAILAAQAAGRTDLAVEGQPEVSAVDSSLMRHPPVAYSRKAMRVEDTVRCMNLGGTVVLTRVPDPQDALAKAQALIDAMNAQAEEEDARTGGKTPAPGDTPDDGSDPGPAED